MKLSFKSVVGPAFILFLICAVITAALAGTNMLTEEKIAQQAALNAENSRKTVLPDADSFELPDGESYAVGMSGGEYAGFVFETSSSGYGGSIKIMTGIDMQGNITGVKILQHSETPGLGANAAKEDADGSGGFLRQFIQPVPEQGIEVVRYQQPGQGQIEALTGATITSRAVTEAVNEAIIEYERVRSEFE